MSASPPALPTPLVCRGARAAEERLLARLDELLDAAVAEPALLARPVRVVVPSGSLRDHVAAALVRRRRRAVAGVQVDTLFAVAAEVLGRAGEVPPAGGVALEILARRFAANMPALRRALQGLADGLGSVVASVRDLLDAGFTAAHLEAAAEQLAVLPAQGLAHGEQVERAEEIARVAAACAEALPELGVGRPGDTYSRAAELLATDPDLLPARAVLIHGFANATGVALDLLEALVGRCRAELVLDLPSDPVEADGAGLAFASRLAQRLGGRSAEELAAAAPVHGAGLAGEVSLVAAPGAYAEAREAAHRVRELLDGGVRPETVGIVARELGPYRLALRQALGRLGVPFSARAAVGSPGATGRRLAAVMDLLARGSQVPADRWLEAARPLGETHHMVALRLGLRSVGAARLADAAALEVAAVLGGRDALPLPVRLGGADSEGDGAREGGDGDAHRRGLARRSLPRQVLERGVSAAGRLVRHLEDRPRQAPLADHLEWVRELLADHLGWPHGAPGDGRSEEVEGREAALPWRALTALSEEIPGELTVSAEEVGVLLRRTLERLEPRPFGGRGGGVQVLNVVEARGRTFRHLFVLGLNRDLFPRLVREDPLLPDAVRRALAAVLPDVPVKADGHAEERYLFAQLLTAAPSVHLSWRLTDDDGAAVPRSPLIDRLLLGLRQLEVEAARHPHDAARPAGGGPLPAHEHAVLAGLAGGHGAFTRLLPAALAEAGCEGGAELARLRGAVLGELDPDLSTPEGRRTARSLGPFLGLVGALGGEEVLSVTTLEGMARCSWRTFLTRTLRLEPAPDPLEELTGLDGLLVGTVVHRALERLVRRALPESRRELAAALAAQAVRVAWPGADALAALTQEAAREVAQREGVPLLARALAARAGGFLEAAARAGLADGLDALGAELEGEVEVGDRTGRRRQLRFRADLADVAGGEVRLTDYKTGKPLSTAAKESTRRRHFLDGVRRGERLQAVAYALAGGEARPAAGRYLFLGRPAEEELERALRVEPGGGDLLPAFGEAVGVLLAAGDAGAFTPRLLDESLEQEGPACRTCEVREACLQGDSGAVRRLARWVEAGKAGGEGEALAAAALAVFRLGEKPQGGEGQ